jgi:hypothetical protein
MNMTKSKVILAIAFVTVLHGCATPSTHLAPAGANIARFDSQTQKAVQKDIEDRGWVFFGIQPNRELATEAMQFVNPSTVKRFGNVARVSTYNAFATQVTPARLGAMLIETQFDCVARTSQIIGIDAYSDLYAKVHIVSSRTAAEVKPVVVNSSNDVVMVAACTGKLEALERASTKSASNNGKI